MIPVVVLALMLGLAPQGTGPKGTRGAKRGAAPQAAAQQPAQPAPQQSDPCDCEVKRPEVFALVNGVRIPAIEVDAEASQLVAPIRSGLSALREKGLREIAVSRLIELEAKRRGMTTGAFLTAEVDAKVQTPTEAEIRYFYERNRSRFNGEFDNLKADLAGYIFNERRQIEMTLFTERIRQGAQIQLLEASPAPPTSQEDRARAVAVVNGTNITLGELEDALRPFLYGFHAQIYQIESGVLDNKISEELLIQEAARRNIPLQALVDAEVTPNHKPVTAFDANTFYNANKAQFAGRGFAEVKDEIIAYLRKAEEQRARRAFADTLRPKASIQIFLPEPPSPIFTVDIADRPMKGNPNAAVTVVEFSDFQCPRCATVHRALEDLLKTYGDKVRIVSRHFPLQQHEFAFRAAEAAEAAREQGKYWEYAALLYANQTSLSIDKMKDLASQLGLDRAKFDAALDSGKFAPAVQRDLLDGERLYISGTPAVYVNGRAVQARTLESLKAAVDAALAPKK